MKQVNGKPKKWQWMLSVGLILTGLLLQLPPFPGVLRDRLAPPLLMSGFVVLLVLWRRVEKFEDLPLEEQKEREREDRDERNQMIYEKAAWRCWQGETVLFIAAYILAGLFWEKIPVINQTSPRIFSLLLLLYWIRILIFELVRWWMNRKY